MTAETTPVGTPLRAANAAKLLLMRVGVLPFFLVAALLYWFGEPIREDRPPARTIAAVSLTSAETSKRSWLPCSACSATFMPIDESPGDDV